MWCISALPLRLGNEWLATGAVTRHDGDVLEFAIRLPLPLTDELVTEEGVTGELRLAHDRIEPALRDFVADRLAIDLSDALERLLNHLANDIVCGRPGES